MRPEPELKNDAMEMLLVAFDPNATDDEVDLARITLVEIVAPDILFDYTSRYRKKTESK